jgi:hypothetical protein
MPRDTAELYIPQAFDVSHETLLAPFTRTALAEQMSATRPAYPDIHGTFGTNLPDRGD